jgi:hypothetical protein
MNSTQTIYSIAPARQTKQKDKRKKERSKGKKKEISEKH